MEWNALSPAIAGALPKGEPWDVRNHRGMGFALCRRCLQRCNTKAKPAIKQEVTNETCFTRRAVD